MNAAASILEMDKKCAYFKNKPIRKPEDMTKKVITKKMDQEWLKHISEKFWFTGFKGDPGLSAHHTPVETLYTLRDTLLSFGGEQACLPALEEDVYNILERGQFWYGNRTLLIEGQPNQCHWNSCQIWYENRDNPELEDLRIATGYALSEDSMWRQHTWLVLVEPRENKIVETTAKRVGYFGFVLTDEEAEQFYAEQI